MDIGSLFFLSNKLSFCYMAFNTIEKQLISLERYCS
uniref:Uncharacterized protein n=1 Tax=mine drainage metagenome TaxID=410659 RepID=E6Q9V7_9ZZZZ